MICVVGVESSAGYVQWYEEAGSNWFIRANCWSVKSFENCLVVWKSAIVEVFTSDTRTHFKKQLFIFCLGELIVTH